MTRRRILLQALIPVLMIWIVVFFSAHLMNADWPDARLAELGRSGIGWQTFTLSIIVISCFLLKARIAMWNRQKRDWLALSFCWMDVSIAVFFGFITFVRLWPGWSVDHLKLYRSLYQAFELAIAASCITFLYFFIDAVIDGRFQRRRDC